MITLAESFISYDFTSYTLIGFVKSRILKQIVF